MSTDGGTRRTRRTRRGSRRFVWGLLLVVGALAVVSGAGGVATIALGPRVTGVQVDPTAAAQASGSRLIVTTSLPLDEVAPEQVTVSPETEFAVDTVGRSVGVRFQLPLWDDTRYTVTFSGLRGLGGGGVSTFTESFDTPPAEVYLLQRGGSDGDRIVRTSLSGDSAATVFTHQHIEDFRATRRYLVISTRNDLDQTELIVTNLDGNDSRPLSLPGDGFVSHLQTADRGDRIGYTFTDRELSDRSGRESELFTMSLDRSGDPATQIRVAGSDPRVAEWSFVPDTDSILMLSFDGTLLLTGPDGEDATALGAALTIDGIARGRSHAVVQRVEERSVIDLTDASETTLVEPDEDLGAVGTVMPLPDGSTIRVGAELDESQLPSGTTVVAVVDPDGATRPLTAVDPADAALHTCVSPSARYAALLIAPHFADNSFDTYALPIPEEVSTRIVEIGSGETVAELSGFDISWCQLAPE